MTDIVNIILTTVLISTVFLTYLSIPNRYRITVRIAIAINVQFLVLILSSYLSLVSLGVIYSEAIVISWFVFSLDFFILISIRDKKGLTHLRDQLRTLTGAPKIKISFYTLVYFISIMLYILIPIVEPLRSLEVAFDWGAVARHETFISQVRQLEFICHIGPLGTLLLIVIVGSFVLAMLNEDSKIVLAVLYFTFALFAVMTPINVLGRPWGNDSYYLGWLISKNSMANYRFQLSDIWYSAFPYTLLLALLKDITGIIMSRVLMHIVPLLNCLIFLFLWTAVSEDGLKSRRSKSLFIIVSFSPILLQYTRIGNTTMLGLYFMLMTIWFMERKRRSSEERAKLDLLLPIMTAVLTGLHHVSALALLLYLVLIPLRDLLANNETIKPRSFLPILGAYFSLEIGGFFMYRMERYRSVLGLNGPLFTPIEIPIGDSLFSLRPIYVLMLIGFYLIVFYIARISQQNLDGETQRKVSVNAFKVSANLAIAGGIGVLLLFVVLPSLANSLVGLSASTSELVVLYSPYFFLLLFMPYLLSRSNREKGYTSLLYAISHVVILVPQFIYNFVDTGLYARLSISVPLLLGLLGSENTELATVFSKEKPVWILLAFLFCLVGLIGSLMASFHYLG